MDVHGAGEIGRAAVMEPIIIGEPGVGLGDGDEITSARVGEAGGGLSRRIPDFSDAGSFFQKLADGGRKRGIVQINVGDLMVGDGENAAGTGIENFAAELFLDGQPALLAKQAVEMDGGIHVGKAVFGEEDDGDAALAEKINEVADDGVHLAQVAVDDGIERGAAGGRGCVFIGGDERPMALEVVIEVRQINET